MNPKDIRRQRISQWNLWCLPLVGLAVLYSEPVADLADRWSQDASYSHGYLVPLFAGYLLWRRRSLIPTEPLRGTALRGTWWGLLPLALAAGMCLVGAWWYYALLAPYSLIPCLAGLCLLAGGWKLFRWALPAIGFLLFMVPLPGRCADMVGQPLQRVATAVSTYTLQLVGFPAVAEGNVILLTTARIGVMEACSGLRMLVLFFALATAVALVSRRPRWEKLLMIASAVPIAVLSNVARITATAAVNEWAGRKWADVVFHDLAGWLMMPLALAMLGIELWIVSRLLPPAEPMDGLLAPAPAANRRLTDRRGRQRR